MAAVTSPERVARTAAALSVVAMVGVAVHLGTEHDVFAASAAVVIALGVVMFTLIAIAGLLLGRSRWSRVLASLVAMFEMALVGISGFTVWGAAAVVAALAGLGLLVAAPLGDWIRPRPAIDAPGPRAVALALGLLALVPAVGLAAPHGLVTGHGLLGSAGVLLGWAYSQAQPWAIWAVRFGLPLVAVPALLSEPWQGAVGLAALVGCLVALAWTAEGYAASAPKPGPLPAPSRKRPSL